MDDKKRSFNDWTVWIWALLLPILYVASTGPVLYLIENSGGHPTFETSVELFYAPLIWAYERNETVHAFFDWYFKFFKLG